MAYARGCAGDEEEKLFAVMLKYESEVRASESVVMKIFSENFFHNVSEKIFCEENFFGEWW